MCCIKVSYVYSSSISRSSLILSLSSFLVLSLLFLSTFLPFFHFLPSFFSCFFLPPSFFPLVYLSLPFSISFFLLPLTIHPLLGKAWESHTGNFPQRAIVRLVLSPYQTRLYQTSCCPLFTQCMKFTGPAPFLGNQIKSIRFILSQVPSPVIDTGWPRRLVCHSGWSRVWCQKCKLRNVYFDWKCFSPDCSVRMFSLISTTNDFSRLSKRLPSYFLFYTPKYEDISSWHQNIINVFTLYSPQKAF